VADPAALIEALENRVAKRYRHLRKWAKREDTNCFRIYDRDIPELAFALDAYGEYLLLQQYVRDEDVTTIPPEAAVAAVARATGCPVERVVLKVRRRVDRRNEQHERTAAGGRMFEVREGGLRFLVNLENYLDTGLFLDHRPLRSIVRARSAGRRVLNLFSYTGSVTTHAAAGGATSTVSVDLSNTYLAWARRNLDLNGFDASRHELVRADVMAWLRNAKGDESQRFDLIVADPPSYSSSKRMDDVFDVQRDHQAIIGGAISLLSPGGEVFFSTNLRGFKLGMLPLGWRAEDISEQTVPEDFRNRRIHSCWRIAAV
jgi:23S rRNA (cytosine1962-C5)-methyltransferase